MHGPDFPRPSAATIAMLAKGSTASYTTIFRRRGIDDIWMDIKPLFAGMRIVGPALTIRTVSHRGDIGRDIAVRERAIPIFCLGSAAPGGTVYNVDYSVPIGCAGCLVCPGDVIVGDDDSVVVIPWAMGDEAAEAILESEARETFIRLMLAQGHPLHGLYPMGPEMEARFLAWRATRDAAS